MYDSGELLIRNNNWQIANTVRLENACVLVVKAIDSGGDWYGILASTSTGVVTDETWKCSAHEEHGRELSGCDDSAWSAARVIGSHGMYPWNDFVSINPLAKWIWAEGSDGGTVYCRKTLC